jgi:hypothetical protein
MPSPRGRIGVRRGITSKKPYLLSLRVLLSAFLLVVLGFYLLVLLKFFQSDGPSNESSTSVQALSTNNQRRDTDTGTTKKGSSASYSHWREVALNLAALSPAQVISTLEEQDPFGVRTFERQLLDAESKKEAFLDLSELRGIFQCPSTRITLPDQRDHSRDRAFRNPPPIGSGKNSTYLFFQHLRKAGGTNFCTLAQRNLPKVQVPNYYCMPDYHWPKFERKCAGCFHRWTNAEIDTQMQAQGHRILGNEWDAFEPERFFELNAIFTTSFRRPLDRALSQFRFECIEDRVSQSVILDSTCATIGNSTLYMYVSLTLFCFLCLVCCRDARLKKSKSTGRNERILRMFIPGPFQINES